MDFRWHNLITSLLSTATIKVCPAYETRSCNLCIAIPIAGYMVQINSHRRRSLHKEALRQFIGSTSTNSCAELVSVNALESEVRLGTTFA